MRSVDVKTKKVTNLVNNLSGAVALTYHNNHYYIGTWGDGSVYEFKQN